MKVVLSHLTGNANVKAAAYGFAEAALMAKFHVSLAAFPGTLLDKLSYTKPFSEISRRKFDVSIKPYVELWPWMELGRLMASKMGLSKLTREKGMFYIDAVCRNLDKRVASKLKYAKTRGASAIYAYEDVAEFSFRQAKKMGLQCLYDMPIGYWRAARRLLEIERERWPEWESTLTGFRDSKIKVTRKDSELHMADRIFAASTFTADTLRDFPHMLAPVEIIPYGFPPVVGAVKKYSTAAGARPLKLLFVGSLSQRKGIANLFVAVNSFKHHVSLTLVGRKSVDDCAVLNAELAKHNWIPTLPHDEVLRLMRESDVLIFPSLFEGFGLVITEAMSQGTPVITTERTAGPDIITHGKNGWLVKAGSILGIQDTIEELLIGPHKIENAGRAAMNTAAKRPWEVYGAELANAVIKHLELC